MTHRACCVRRKFNGRRRCRLDDAINSLAAEHVVHDVSRDVTQTADDVGKLQPNVLNHRRIGCHMRTVFRGFILFRGLRVLRA